MRCTVSWTNVWIDVRAALVSRRLFLSRSVGSQPTGSSWVHRTHVEDLEKCQCVALSLTPAVPCLTFVAFLPDCSLSNGTATHETNKLEHCRRPSVHFVPHWHPVAVICGDVAMKIGADGTMRRSKPVQPFRAAWNPERRTIRTPVPALPYNKGRTPFAMLDLAPPPNGAAQPRKGHKQETVPQWKITKICTQRIIIDKERGLFAFPRVPTSSDGAICRQVKAEGHKAQH